MKHILADSGCTDSDCSGFEQSGPRGSEALQFEQFHGETLDAKSLLHHAVELCVEAKGKDITVLDVSQLTDICEYFVVVSGRSDRQVQGLCNRVIEGLAQHGAETTSAEGIEKGHWVVLDFGDVIMHVFYEALRPHYDIEGLWAKAPRLKELERLAQSASVRAA
jgi:ribosome-associated protein